MGKAKERFMEVRELEDVAPVTIGTCIRRYIKEADRTPRNEAEYEKAKQQLINATKKLGL